MRKSEMNKLLVLTLIVSLFSSCALYDPQPSAKERYIQGMNSQLNDYYYELDQALARGEITKLEYEQKILEAKQNAANNYMALVQAELAVRKRARARAQGMSEASGNLFEAFSR